jgi:putative heme-binding domain-containing protein
LQAAAELALAWGLAPLRERLAEAIVSPRADPPARAALGRALAALDADPLAAALAPAMGDASVAASLREAIAGAIARRDGDSLKASLAESLRWAPARLQTQLAQSLSGDRQGASELIELVAAGLASPRLLADPAVRTKLVALDLPGVEERVDALTADLPAASDEIQQEIFRQIVRHRQGSWSAEAGAAVFTKHCAACHQIAGRGAVVGPQLDGIGNRGLERIVEDLLDPNRNVDAAFRTTTLALSDGRVLSALVRREEGEALIVVDNQGKEHTIVVDEIDARRASPLSLMPANLKETLSEDEMHSLLEHLLAQRGEKDAPQRANGPETKAD